MLKKRGKTWGHNFSRKREAEPPSHRPFCTERREEEEGEEEGPAVEIKEDKFSKCKFAPKPLNFGCFGAGFWISIVVGGFYFVVYGVVCVMGL